MKKLILILLLIPLTITAAPTEIKVTEIFWTLPTVNNDGTPLTDLGGSRIYCRTETTNFPQLGFDVPDPTASAVLIGSVVNMATDEKYTCSVTAYNTNGDEGAYGPEFTFLVVAGSSYKNVTVPAAPVSSGVR